MPYEIERKRVEPEMVACSTAEATIAEMPERMGEVFQRVMAEAIRAGAEPKGPAFAEYLNRSEPFEFRAGFPVEAAFEGDNGVECREGPGGDVVATVHTGPYETLHEAYAALMEYAAVHQLTPGDTMWEYYWTNPDETPNPQHYKTEVFLPLG